MRHSAVLRATATVLLLAAVGEAQWWSWLWEGPSSVISALGASWRQTRNWPSREVHPDSSRTTPQLLEQFGYPVEVHHVTTDDGYVLEMHRMPGDGPPALVNHGVICSSADWVLAGPGKALGLVLADAGYDVWLGNFRGNRYSNRHINLTTDSLEYWDFSFHEMGVHDIPAEIDYILNATGRSELCYAGFSMGVAAFLVTTSQRPEYNDKVSAFVGLAPAAYMGHTTAPFYRLASFGLDVLQFGNLFGLGEFTTSNSLLARLGQQYCEANPLYQDLCSHAVFLVVGFNSPQFNKTLLPIVLGHIPAGASAKTMVHFVQGMSSGKFRQYDDRVLPTLLSSWEPPDYDLSRLTAPTLFLYGNEDWVVNNTDAERTFRELTGAERKELLLIEGFNHIDFLYAINASSLVYSKVVEFFDNSTKQHG